MSKSIWTRETILDAIEKCNGKKEFRDKYPGAINRLRNAEFADLKEMYNNLSSPVKRWTDAELIAVADSYDNYAAFYTTESKVYNHLRLRGMVEAATKHMIKDKPRKWTAEAVMAEALKYNYIADLKDANESAYNAAKRLGIRDAAFAHMSKGRTHRTKKWNYESIHTEALKYEYRWEFGKNSAGAYQAAAALGITDEVCSHMIASNKHQSDKDAIYLWKVVGMDNIYKVGITSARLGIERVDYVARRGGLDAELIILVQIEDAYAVEQEILNSNQTYTFDKDFSGSKEFLTLNAFDLIRVHKRLILESEKCIQKQL